jgi:3-oxoacyl-[acyl-carrier protein] reductase
MSEKILLVSGASSDVGIALIKRVAPRYDKIIAHYHSSVSKIEALQVKFGGKLIPIKADLSDYEQVKKLAGEVEKHSVSGFVHLPASAAAMNVRFGKTAWELFEEDLNISLRSAVLLSQACLKSMTKQKYGRIVFMLTSFLTSDPPPKFSSAYMTVKSALFGLMKALAVEYAAKGITVNGVSPAMIETNFHKNTPRQALELNAQNSPLGRNLVPGDVTSAFEFLLSDGAECVTGQNIAVTGGN